MGEFYFSFVRFVCYEKGFDINSLLLWRLENPTVEIGKSSCVD